MTEQGEGEEAMPGVRFVLMRGGTSKCAMFHENHLPPRGAERDQALLAMFGSPDPRQIDGIGGGVSSTSKACIIASSLQPDADVDYTFGQVSVTQAVVDYKGACGNCSAAVGPFAIDEGIVCAREGVTTVRIFNTNTRKLIVAEVQVQGGHALQEGDCEIAGVPGSGAPQRLWFVDPAGSVTGKLFPTGRRLDTVTLRGRNVSVTIIDAGNPVVLADARDLDLTGTESAQAIDQRKGVMDDLEEIRGQAAVLLGFAGRFEDARKGSPAIPKVAVVGPAQTYQDAYGRKVEAGRVALVARMISMERCHTAYPLTGAIATSTAARVEGTVASGLAKVHVAEETPVFLGHPSGIIRVDLELESEDGEPRVRRAGIYRTARRMVEGIVHYRARG